jgi:mono/diheme cytochrome c family protein
MARRLLIAACITAAALLSSGCGSQSVSVPTSDANHNGAVLFAARCGACHTLEAAGTQGSATNVADKETVDGPNLDFRHEAVPDVLFAIANGGFSGAIMPENIVTGKEADEVAKFVSEYAGKKSASSGG